MIAFEMKNGDLYFKDNDLVVLNEKEKAIQDIVELIKHIQGTYDLRTEIGIPWLDYIGQLKSQEREDLMITYMYEKVSSYKGVDLSSIIIEKSKSENRVGFFSVRFNYFGEETKIEIDRREINGWF